MDSLQADPHSRSQTIEASGTGTVSLKATLAHIQLISLSQAKDAGKAQKDLDANAAKLLKFLRDAKVDKLRTVGYEIRPKVSYKQGVATNQGFEGTHAVSFEVALDQVGKILDAAIKNGASEIRNVSFTVTDKEKDEARKQALDKASKKALAEGQLVLKQLGLDYQGIETVAIDSPQTGPIHRHLSTFASEARAGGSEVEGGSIEIEARVRLLLKYKN